MKEYLNKKDIKNRDINFRFGNTPNLLIQNPIRWSISSFLGFKCMMGCYELETSDFVIHRDIKMMVERRLRVSTK